MRLFAPKEIKSREQSRFEVSREQESRVARAIADKIKLNNTLAEEHAKKMEERRVELAEIEFKVRTSTLEEQRKVELLEERKKQALAPILVEISLLEEKRSALEHAGELLESTKSELVALQRAVRECQDALKASQKAFSTTQQEVLRDVAEKKRDAEQATAKAVTLIAMLRKEQADHSSSLILYEEKLRNAERAEKIAKAAMIAADNSIVKERAEQARTVEQRKMLGIAIKELKDRGLWRNKLLEMQIK